MASLASAQGTFRLCAQIRMTTFKDQSELLFSIARASPSLMSALNAARSLGLKSWCVGAGAVRNSVWNHLHHIPHEDNVSDVDLVFFDLKMPPNEDRLLEGRLSGLLPGVCWDVTNQAHVHLWYEQHYGTAVQAVTSMSEGIATWPEYATCVGLALNADDTMDVIAPYGLDDLFALLLRHNPLRATRDVFVERIATRGWLQRWPKLRLDDHSSWPDPL